MRCFEQTRSPDSLAVFAAVQSKTRLGLAALLSGLTLACVAAGPAVSCRVLETEHLSLASYKICVLADLPVVFDEPELAALFAGLAPGQSREVTGNFLRVAAPWPYLDIGGSKGAGGSDGGNPQPNRPHAVFVLRSHHPSVQGPLLLVAPAQLQHHLVAAGADALPRDSWQIRAGPYAPTLYGRLRRDGALVNIIAFPSSDPAASAPVGRDQRSALIDQIVAFFMSE